MKALIKTFDDLPLILKIVLALPALDICWVVYRICKSIDKGNTLGIILGIVFIFFAPLLWLVDIICLVLSGKVWWIC